MAKYFGNKRYNEDIYIIEFDDNVHQGEQGSDSIPNIDLFDNTTYNKKYKSVLIIGQGIPEDKKNIYLDIDSTNNTYYYNLENSNIYYCEYNISGIIWKSILNNISLQIKGTNIYYLSQFIQLINDSNSITILKNEIPYKIKINKLNISNINHEMIGISNSEFMSEQTNISFKHFDNINQDNKYVKWNPMGYWELNGIINASQIIGTSSTSDMDIEYYDIVINNQSLFKKVFIDTNGIIDDNLEIGGKKINNIWIKNGNYQLENDLFIKKNIRIISEESAIINMSSSSNYCINIDQDLYDIKLVLSLSNINTDLIIGDNTSGLTISNIDIDIIINDYTTNTIFKNISKSNIKLTMKKKCDIIDIFYNVTNCKIKGIINNINNNIPSTNIFMGIINDRNIIGSI